MDHESQELTPREASNESARLLETYAKSTEQLNRSKRVAELHQETRTLLENIINMAPDEQSAALKELLSKKDDNVFLLESVLSVLRSQTSHEPYSSSKAPSVKKAALYEFDDAIHKYRSYDSPPYKYSESLLNVFAEALPAAALRLEESITKSEDTHIPNSSKAEADSLKAAREHAEKYMGQLQTAALAEAALDGVQINRDDAIKINKAE